MTKQSPNGRYQVFSLKEYQNYPEAIPAGRYDNLLDATCHANSVTYAMGVVDSLAESRGLVYVNAAQEEATKYRIERTIPGGFRDFLSRLWEGNDLPTFAGSHPYEFSGKAEADRVAWRLAAKYPETMATPRIPARPITYSVVPVEDGLSPEAKSRMAEMVKQALAATVH